MPVAGDPYWDLLAGKPPFKGLSASCRRRFSNTTFAGFARHFARPLEGTEKEGLVDLDDVFERRRLVVARRLDKAMPPAERRRFVETADLGSFAHTRMIDERRRVGEPDVALVQAGERCTGQRRECSATVAASVAPEVTLVAPCPDLPRCAVGAERTITKARLDNGDRVRARARHRRRKRPRLVRRQLAEPRQKVPEFLRFHRLSPPIAISGI